MDAVEFLKEYRRMCKEYADNEDCSPECPLNTECYGYLDYKYVDIQNIVTKVQQWSQTHPQKTMMQDFFEKFPNAPKTGDGEPIVCPQELGYGDFCCDDTNHNCIKCWSRPLKN